MSTPRERNVLVILHEASLGGATQSVLRVAPLLESRGWRLCFWVARPSPLAAELERRGLEVHGRPRPVGYSAATLWLPPGPRARIVAAPAYFRALRRLIRSRGF